MRPPKYDWVQTHGIKLAVYAVSVLILIVFFAGMAMTMVSQIEPGQVGVVINNMNGDVETRKEPGIIYHMPFGITDVYKLDSRLQVFEMAGSRKERGRQVGENVTVKTIDGGDVIMDLTLNYRIDPDRGADVARYLGAGKVVDESGQRDDQYKIYILRSYARSAIRDGFGTLTITEISDASTRSAKLGEVQRRLNDDLNPWGILVETVSASNFSFNPEYEQLIKERKGVDQEITNQTAAQETARREQTTQLNAANREKSVSLRRIQGEMRKREIEAMGLAEQKKKRAEGEGYRLKKSGDSKYAVAEAESKAVEAEGLKRAEGIQELSNAYREGGIALVLEALAEKYSGKQISGRPYNLETTIDRLQIERDVQGAASQTLPPARPAPAAGARGGVR